MGWNAHLPKAEWHSPTPPAVGSRWVNDTKDWIWDPEPIIRELMAQDVVAIDTETTGLNVMKDMPLFWSLAWGERRVCMSSSTLPYFQQVFRDRNKRWILANAKFDMHMLANVGVTLAGDVCDVAVMHALLYEEASHRLKDMAKTVLGWGWTEFKETFGIRTTADGIIGKTLLLTEQENLPLLVEYASNDAYGTLKVYEALKKELEETKTFSFYQEEFNTMGDIFFKTEMPYTRVLWKCERQGIPINAAYLKSIEGPCQQDIDSIQRKIVSLAGSMLNPNSPLQLRDYFFNHLKLRPIRYTSGGKTGVKSPSTDSDFLEHYAPTVPMAQLILDFRELEKLKGTYIEGLQSRMDQNNRIHTRFNQDVARCMPAGELVLTSRGYLPVESVGVGDFVITHTGKTQKVVECSGHPPRSIFFVQLDNGLTLRTTGNHEYCLAGETPDWRKASELLPGDIVAVHSSAEEWRDIPHWSNFEVSSWGRVRNKRTGNLLALQPKNEWGHLRVTLRREGAQYRGENLKDYSVHRLVLMVFEGPSDQEVRHLNGIAWDNTLANLKYGTAQENREDALRHGTMSQRRAGRSILTQADVDTIRATARAGQPPSSTSKLTQEIADSVRAEAAMGASALSKKHDVSYQAIDSILKNRTWVRKADPNARTAEDLANQYGVSAGTIRTIWSNERWQPEDYIEGSFASFHEAKVVSVEVQAPEVTYGLTVEEDHSHVTGGIVTHNTGRLSSADPNMQNIPTVENDKFKLRGAFIAANDSEELIVADYEALEMRLLASASLEKKMIQIFLDKKDIHMGNAAMVFGKKFNTTYEEIVDAKKVDKKVKNGELPESAMTERHHLCLQLRAQVKNIAFGLNYGMKENKLARDLNVTKEQALSLMSEYMDTYPAVKQFYAEAIAETRQTGYSYTFIGRRRYHPAIGSMRDMDRWEEERKAVNNNIQGTAADVVRFAMLLCDAAGLEYKYGCKMNLQVHDELVFECPKETVKEAKEEVKYLMEHPFVLDMAVPLTVSIGSGPSWMHAK